MQHVPVIPKATITRKVDCSVLSLAQRRVQHVEPIGPRGSLRRICPSVVGQRWFDHVFKVSIDVSSIVACTDHRVVWAAWRTRTPANNVSINNSIKRAKATPICSDCAASEHAVRRDGAGARERGGGGRKTDGRNEAS